MHNGGIRGNWPKRDTLTTGAAPELSTGRLLSPLTTTRLFFNFFFSSTMMNGVAYFQLLHGGFIIFFINCHDYLNWPIRLPAMTSACYFKDTLRSETQNFLIPNSHLHFVYLTSTSVIPPIKWLSYFHFNRGNFKASPAEHRVLIHLQ